MQYRKEYTQYTVHNDTQTILIDGHEMPFPSAEYFFSVLQSAVGTHNFPLTPFSAKKIEGKKLYEYAREGNPVFMDIPMTIIAFQILDITFPQITLELHV